MSNEPCTNNIGHLYQLMLDMTKNPFDGFYRCQFCNHESERFVCVFKACPTCGQATHDHLPDPPK